MAGTAPPLRNITNAHGKESTLQKISTNYELNKPSAVKTMQKKVQFVTVNKSLSSKQKDAKKLQTIAWRKAIASSYSSTSSCSSDEDEEERRAMYSRICNRLNSFDSNASESDEEESFLDVYYQNRSKLKTQKRKIFRETRHLSKSFEDSYSCFLKQESDSCDRYKYTISCKEKEASNSRFIQRSQTMVSASPQRDFYSRLRNAGVMAQNAQLRLNVCGAEDKLTVTFLGLKSLPLSSDLATSVYLKISLTPEHNEIRLYHKSRMYHISGEDHSANIHDSFTFKIGKKNTSRRLLISAWSMEAEDKLPTYIGCMSFGIRNIFNSRKVIQGWYYFLREFVGRRKHLMAPKIVSDDYQQSVHNSSWESIISQANVSSLRTLRNKKSKVLYQEEYKNQLGSSSSNIFRQVYSKRNSLTGNDNCPHILHPDFHFTTSRKRKCFSVEYSDSAHPNSSHVSKLHGMVSLSRSTPILIANKIFTSRPTTNTEFLAHSGQKIQKSNKYCFHNLTAMNHLSKFNSKIPDNIYGQKSSSLPQVNISATTWQDKHTSMHDGVNFSTEIGDFKCNHLGQVCNCRIVTKLANLLKRNMCNSNEISGKNLEFDKRFVTRPSLLNCKLETMITKLMDDSFSCNYHDISENNVEVHVTNLERSLPTKLFSWQKKHHLNRLSFCDVVDRGYYSDSGRLLTYTSSVEETNKEKEFKKSKDNLEGAESILTPASCIHSQESLNSLYSQKNKLLSPSDALLQSADVEKRVESSLDRRCSVIKEDTNHFLYNNNIETSVENNVLTGKLSYLKTWFQRRTSFDGITPIQSFKPIAYRRHLNFKKQASIRKSKKLIHQTNSDEKRTLIDLLQKKDIEEFRLFLRGEYSEENLNFWLDCEAYKRLKGSKQHKIAQKIFQRYLAHDSPNEVNIDARTRQTTQLQLSNNNLTPETFSDAQNSIYKLMETDSFRRFRCVQNAAKSS